MTDTTVAPDTGTTADTSAPAANEVPINPSPVSAPSPIGSQAPQAPRDAKTIIQDAYNRALNPPPKPQRPPAKEPAKEPPKAAEAKPGHNKPPEKTESLNLKKRPDDQPLPQPRDRGRFAPRQEATADKSTMPAAEGDGAPASQPTPSPAHPPLPHNAPFREPPPRISEAARRDWDATPETVRGDIHRLHQEFSNAYNQYREAAHSFAPIAHYHQMAQKHGTTLQQALDNYVGMETKLRADPVAGLDLIVHNLGLKTPDGEPIGFRDIAYHVLSQTPDQLRSLQQGNTVNATQHQIGALHQQVAGLTNALQQMQYNQQYGHTLSAIDAFAANNHPRFDELSATIDQELKSGYDLETAYRRAELLHPTTQAAQTRDTSAQTRPPDRSISGVPGGSANGAAQPRRGESRSLRDTIEHSTRRVSNGY